MSNAAKFLTPKQLCERWEGAVKILTLANWRAATPTRGPAFSKIGSRVLYPLEEIEKWEAANLKKPANDNQK